MLARTLLIPLRRTLLAAPAAVPRLASATTQTPTRALSQWRSPARPALTTTATALLQQQVRGMKVRSSVKKLCDGCKVRAPSTGPPGRQTADGRRTREELAS